jgi:HlyD family secretion protein
MTNSTNLKSVKKRLISVFLMLLIIAVLFFVAGCRKEMPEIETFTVTRGDIIETVSSTGTVDAVDKRNYSLTQSAEVIEILDQGDAFKKGDVLIKIDDSKTMLYITQAEQNLELAKKSIDIAKINYQSALDANHVAVQLSETNTEMALQATETAFKALENANELSRANINAASNAIETAEEYLDDVKDSPISTDILVAQAEGNVTTSEGAYEQAKKSSKTQADAAEGSYEQSILNQSVTYWNNINSLEMASAQIQLMKKGIEQAQIQLELANINLELVKTELDNFQVYAPFDGIVSVANFKPGETAGPGIAAISIISSDFIIKSDIDETDIVKLSFGLEAEITLDAYPDMSFTGTISKISPLSKNIAGIITYEIEILPDAEAKDYLRHGLSANLNTTISGTSDVLFIPVQAVYEEDGKNYADLLVGEMEVKKTEIVTGGYNYDYIEIKSGLSEGDIIVISGLETITDTQDQGGGPFGMMQ